MTLQIWFWLVMAVWLLFGIWRGHGKDDFLPYVGGVFVEFILFIIIGWQVFGSPVK